MVFEGGLWEVTEVRRGHEDWALVAHVCNPSYSEDRDQEDLGQKPSWAKANSS
jgi:hypothetical protein